MAIMNKNGGMRSQRDDSISGVPTEKYKSNFDKIFGKKKEKKIEEVVKDESKQ